jgi:hypothetical protein
MPKKCPARKKKLPAYDEALNHKNKKTERIFGFYINAINVVTLFVNG